MAIGTIGALIGGSLLGGAVSAIGANKAAGTQADAARDAGGYQLQAARETNALQERIYDETVERNEPARQMGLNALRKLGGMTDMNAPTGFRQDPGYQFALEEGQNALDRRASAGGMRLSGAALKDAMRYGTGMANQQYGDWWNRQRNLQDANFNRTASVAGVGQTATQALDRAGSSFAGNVGATNQQAASGYGNALMQAGQARASGYQGVGNAINNSINSIGTSVAGAYGGYFGQNPGFGITPFGNPYA